MNNWNNHTVLLRDLRTPKTKGHLLYYYQGNFYYPLELYGPDGGRVKRAIREFTKANACQIQKDRGRPDYKTKLEIFDEDMPE